MLDNDNMKNFEITKKMFFFTATLLIVDLIVFFINPLLSFAILWYGAIFYLPLLLIIILVDRFYFKNRSPYLLKNLILVTILALVAYLSVQSYLDSFSLI